MLRGASRPLLSWLAGALGALPRLPAVHSACDRLASAQDASASASLSFHSLVRRLTAGSPARGGGPSWSGTTDGSFWRALSSQAAVSRLASAQARQKRLQAARRQRQSQPSQAPASPPPAAAASAGPAVVPPGSTAGITASTSKATDVQLDRAVGHPALIVTRESFACLTGGRRCRWVGSHRRAARALSRAPPDAACWLLVCIARRRRHRVGYCHLWFRAGEQVHGR